MFSRLNFLLQKIGDRVADAQELIGLGGFVGQNYHEEHCGLAGPIVPEGGSNCHDVGG